MLSLFHLANVFLRIFFFVFLWSVADLLWTALADWTLCWSVSVDCPNSGGVFCTIRICGSSAFVDKLSGCDSAFWISIRDGCQQPQWWVVIAHLHDIGSNEHHWLDSWIPVINYINKLHSAVRMETYCLWFRSYKQLKCWFLVLAPFSVFSLAIFTFAVWSNLRLLSHETDGTRNTFDIRTHFIH